VYSRLRGFGVDEEGKNLELYLCAPHIRMDLKNKFEVPFDSDPDQAAELVRKLFPIGHRLKRSIREIKSLLK
jgi:hypothetical protein